MYSNYLIVFVLAVSSIKIAENKPTSLFGNSLEHSFSQTSGKTTVGSDSNIGFNSTQKQSIHYPSTLNLCIELFKKIQSDKSLEMFQTLKLQDLRNIFDTCSVIISKENKINEIGDVRHVEESENDVREESRETYQDNQNHLIDEDIYNGESYEYDDISE
jgi:hypothetical protein